MLYSGQLTEEEYQAKRKDIMGFKAVRGGEIPFVF